MSLRTGKWAVVVGMSLCAVSILQAAEVSQTTTSSAPEIVVRERILQE